MFGTERWCCSCVFFVLAVQFLFGNKVGTTRSNEKSKNALKTEASPLVASAVPEAALAESVPASSSLHVHAVEP